MCYCLTYLLYVNTKQKPNKQKKKRNKQKPLPNIKDLKDSILFISFLFVAPFTGLTPKNNACLIPEQYCPWLFITPGMLGLLELTTV